MKVTKEIYEKDEILVNTNIGEIPVAEYADMYAAQNGFDDYLDCLNQGVCIYVDACVNQED